MRQLLAAAATVAAVLLPAAPATTGPAPAPGTVPTPASTSSSHRDGDREGPRRLPEPFDRAPAEGCIVPAVAGLEACPPEAGRRPVVTCVLPVRLPPGTVEGPGCERRDPFPQGRVVPVSP